jgi:hypothetical protein
MPASLPTELTKDAAGALQGLQINTVFQPYKLYNIIKRMKHHVITNIKTKCKRISKIIKVGSYSLYESIAEVEIFFNDLLNTLDVDKIRSKERLTDKEAEEKRLKAEADKRADDQAKWASGIDTYFANSNYKYNSDGTAY